MESRCGMTILQMVLMAVLWAGCYVDGVSIAGATSPLEDEEISSAPECRHAYVCCLTDLGIADDGRGPITFQIIAAHDYPSCMSVEQYARIVVMITEYRARLHQSVVPEHTFNVLHCSVNRRKT